MLLPWVVPPEVVVDVVDATAWTVAFAGLVWMFFDRDDVGPHTGDSDG